MAVVIAPYGSWESPISSDVVIEKSVSLKEVKVDPYQEDTVFWSEMRPDEGGRYVVCSFTEGQEDFKSLTPKDFSCRTLVHEYGGGAFIVNKYRIYFSNYKDQRMYCQKVKKGVTAEPIPLTPEDKNWRYADASMFKKHIILCVREDHEVISQGEKEAQNTLVSINRKTKEQFVLVSGKNFYSTPRVSQAGTLAWIQWDHPNMPWDFTELWVGELSHDGQSLKDGTKRKVLPEGDSSLSVMLPKWSPDDKLMFIHDKTNWWNLYQLDGDKETNLHPVEKEIGGPAWEFARSPYSCNPTGNGEVLVICGKDIICLKTSEEPQVVQLDVDYKLFRNVNYSANGKHAYLVAGSPKTFTKLIKLDVKTGSTTVIRACHSSNENFEPYYSVPKEVTWSTTYDAKAHGFYYPPQNKMYKGPKDQYPPLLVKVHGGPTASCSPSLDLQKQFFTSRGFAILDVNYRGSTGFGTTYRNALKSKWGILDIEDCCTGAQAMADQGKADPAKLAIDGGSAGGFAALAAITYHNVFSAATSFYGVSDLAALAAETHKFESRYLDTLIGPYPEEEKVYIARSPINRVDLINSALCIFQGSEDKIVPPNQAQMMYEAVKQKGNPVAYKEFEGEQHGFRKAENIKFCLDGEFYFYSKIFKFDAKGIEVDLPIDNLPDEGKN